MPIYVYFCKQCSKKFDLLVGMTQDKVEIKCPRCKTTKVEKLVTGFGIGAAPSNSGADGARPSCGSCSSGSCSSCGS